MGNVHASISSPEQLLPFGSYIAEIPEIRFINMLGSTRFMKVAYAEHLNDGPIVVKAFVLVDQSVSLDPYKDIILRIRNRLAIHPNCCPFSRIYMTSRCAILTRPYHKFTLYERLSTQPFLLDVEKKWIVFQLLKALAQCRIAMTCHGDIKSENVLVSSSLWVQLADFAPYKPAFLPYDNPSNFTYFFDTSRRRCCNLAPERFKRSEELNYSSRLPGDNCIVSDGLTASMDIFATGCVIVELLMNSQQIAFTLSQAIDYKRMDENYARRYLAALVSGLPEEYRPLLTAMLARDPKRRREEYEEVGSPHWGYMALQSKEAALFNLLLSQINPCSSPLFPPIFEKFLYRYVKEFRQSPMTADDIITKLYVEFDNYLPNLEIDKHQSVVIVVGLVTSTMRACHSLNSKMDAIALLHKLSKLCSTAIVADRIVPYLVPGTGAGGSTAMRVLKLHLQIHLFNDPIPQIRSESITVLVEVLSEFDEIPPEECRLLIHYVVPKLIAFANRDDAVVPKCVKIALASNLGRLALISLSFLDLCVNRVREEVRMMGAPPTTVEDAEGVTGGADLEESLIQDEKLAVYATIGELFNNLFGCDTDVRRCVVSPDNLQMLCRFFGRSGVTVLGHLITVLNDVSDWRTRATFFESCSVVASCLRGVEGCAKELDPLLLEGLQDCEEFVVLRTLQCIHALCAQQLLPLSTVYRLLPSIVPFLVHPNPWLRVTVVDLLSVLDAKLSVADLYCKVTPLLTKQYLIQPLIRLNNRAVITQCLAAPIPRQIWDVVVDYARTAELLSALENRRMLEKLGGGKNSLFSAITPTTQATGEIGTAAKAPNRAEQKDVPLVASMIKKLLKLGLDDATEEKLLGFQSVLTNAKKSNKDDNSPSSKQISHIHLADLLGVVRKVFDLERGIHREYSKSSIDWRDVLDSTLSTTDISTRERLLNDYSTCVAVNNQFDVLSHSITNHNLVRCSISRFNLAETLHHKLCRYQAQRRITTSTSISLSGDSVVDRIAAAAIDGESALRENGSTKRGKDVGKAASSSSTKRRVELKLIAHLHEHESKIVKLALNPDKDHFVSCGGRDKLIKVWSASSLQSHDSHPAWMSQDALKFPHQILSTGFMGDGNLAIATSEGELQVFDIEYKRLIKSYAVDLLKEGAISTLHCHEHLIYALTQHNSVYCFDLRVTPSNSRSPIELEAVWKRRARNNYGLVTSFCVDAINQHWMLLTGSSTTTKNLLLWDLRFGGLEVATWSHPSDRVIPLQSWPRPGRSTCSHVFTNCSREGEVSVWDLSSQSRTDVLWPSSEQPLNYKEELVTTALATSCIDTDMIFTGDSEGSLRCWNMKRADASNYLCGPYRKHLSNSTHLTTPSGGPSSSNEINTPAPERIRYRQMKYRDNILRVQVEDKNQIVSAVEKDSHKALRVGEYHFDSITDLLSIWPDVLVSADRQGIVKVWTVI